MLQGFGERMPDELTASAPYAMRIKVTCQRQNIGYGLEKQAHFTLSGTSPAQEHHLDMFIPGQVRCGVPARISPKSVPKGGDHVKEHEGSMSEVLTYVQDRS